MHNDVTYPWLRKLFGELGIQVRRTEMSMSVRCEGCGLEYAGGRGLRGVLAQPRRLLDPRFIRMLWQVKRFHRRAAAFLRAAAADDLTTYGEFLQREGFSILHRPLRRAGRLVRVVRGQRDGAALPGPLPVHGSSTTTGCCG